MDEVGFEIEVDAGDIYLVGWNEMDAALQHPAFSKLRKVEVRVVQWADYYTDSVDVSRIMDVMSQCHARGILDIREVVRQYSFPPDRSFEGFLIDST